MRTYTFAKAFNDSVFLGTTSGEICIFNIDGKIYKATMPIGNNGVTCLANTPEAIFIGGGDAKLKRIFVSEDGKWNLTHEA